MQTTVERPAPRAGSIAQRLAVQDKARRKTQLRLAKLRRKAADEIDRLIAFLDESDSYVTTEREEDDAEPSLEHIARAGQGFSFNVETEDDEPSLCGITASGLNLVNDAACGVDCEQEQDDEPSLGFTNGLDQSHLCEGQGGLDAEDEHDGAEPEIVELDESEKEPSLGWPEGFDQRRHVGALHDGEAGPGPRKPQNRIFVADRGITTKETLFAASFRSVYQLQGLTNQQAQRIDAKQRRDGGRLR